MEGLPQSRQTFFIGNVELTLYKKFSIIALL